MRIRGFLLLVVILLAHLVVVKVSQLHAQEGGANWDQPLLLFDSSGQYGEHHTLCSDIRGDAYLFWEANASAPSQSDVRYASDQMAIFYSHWDGEKWSDPVDVAFGRVSFPRAVVDIFGSVHLVYQAGCFEYSRSVCAEASLARSWSPGRCLSDSGLSHAITTDLRGVLHVVLARNDQALSYFLSEDHGETWSSPRIIHTGTGAAFAYLPDIAVDSGGIVHVVWTEVEPSLGPTGIYYSSSLDGGESWAEPVLLDSGNRRDPVLFVSGEEVHVAWNTGVAISKRFYAFSADRGKSWTQPEQLIAKHGGWLWSPAMVVDDYGTVHIVTAQSEGAFYIYGRPGQWSEPHQIFDGGQISAPQMEVLRGNELLLVFRGPAGSIWYVCGHLPGPGRPAGEFLPPLDSSLITRPYEGRVLSLTESTSLPGRTQVATGWSARTRVFVAPVIWGVIPVIVFLIGVALLIRSGRSGTRFP